MNQFVMRKMRMIFVFEKGRRITVCNLLIICLLQASTLVAQKKEVTSLEFFGRTIDVIHWDGIDYMCSQSPLCGFDGYKHLFGKSASEPIDPTVPVDIDKNYRARWVIKDGGLYLCGIEILKGADDKLYLYTAIEKLTNRQFIKDATFFSEYPDGILPATWFTDSIYLKRLPTSDENYCDCNYRCESFNEVFFKDGKIVSMREHGTMDTMIDSAEIDENKEKYDIRSNLSVYRKSYCMKRLEEQETLDEHHYVLESFRGNTCDQILRNDSLFMCSESPLAGIDGFLNIYPDITRLLFFTSLPIFHEKNYSTIWTITNDTLYLCDVQFTFKGDDNYDEMYKNRFEPIEALTQRKFEQIPSSSGKGIPATWYSGSLYFKRFPEDDELVDNRCNFRCEHFYKIRVEKGKVVSTEQTSYMLAKKRYINPPENRNDESGEKDTMFRLEKKAVMPLSLNKTPRFDRIPELKTKKIIAIGETIHGTETMNQMAFQLIKHQIKNNNCRLVLLELGMEKMLSFNRFVQNDASFDIDSLIDQSKAILISSKQLKEFCVWLKDYNKTAKEKVWLLGTDFSRSSFDRIYICEYLYNLNRFEQNPAIYKLYQSIYDEMFFGDFTNTLQILSDSGLIIKNIIGKTETEIIKYNITQIHEMKKTYANDRVKMYSLRDSIMYVNTEWLFDLLKPEKVAIFQHWAHVNYVIGADDRKPFGGYLKEKYGDDVFCTSICAQKGDFLTHERDTVASKAYMAIHKLEEPPSGSLEYYLSEVKESAFYVYTSALPLKSMPRRSVGNTDLIRQFGVVAPVRNTDGIIFVHHCDAIDYPRALLNEPIVFDYGIISKHGNRLYPM